MKKHLLLVLTSVCLITLANAQIKKGSVLLGGGIAFTKVESETTENKTNAINVGPSVGFAIKDNWVVGLSTSFSSFKVKSNISIPKSETTGFSTTLFANRYVSLGRSFYLYGGASIGYGKRETETIQTDTKSKMVSQSVTASMAPGLAYAVSKRFHLEAYLNNLLTLGYSKVEKENTTSGVSTITKDKIWSFQTNFNPTAPLSIGFRFVLGK